ncbi:hypothetical protein B0J13DRAFT_625462 [Dactylonectria estremocensis]|uniref:Uncharacterized protein n=1 Tax=Dactylonectria estremocensis TaxID=1079267 RepID=A0A9P9IX17_9HYPO|nr:hypothetical protein B0J13DRAFT_625462 [Dactylonectria estremocensis]
MRFSTLVLLLTPLVAAASVKETAHGLPELTPAEDSGYELESTNGGLSLAAVRVCPAKYPRLCSVNKNICCKTKKCCKKQCCTNDTKYWTESAMRWL